ncbi:MAPK/MAK/MRK overlapping kinase [Geodia barretti]|uniref:MAPK/MAK/MRK overlapping kinase n=1 Tax=Geodia barretti TaxID=519541 RepID=A0AA35U017_GEOBA|nr:MAPK/MAK/MRK overlapping kinase [Geodia barretti]
MALICELMDMNIYELIKDRKSYLPEQRVKLYMYQLCKAIYHMHRNGIFHRDVKPENILIKDSVLKLADFGSCKSVYSNQPYTEYISTRWYRAPECLLTDGHYSYKMDMWSVGCVMYEVMRSVYYRDDGNFPLKPRYTFSLSLRPLFPGSNELDQVSKIHGIIGTPSRGTLRKLKKFQSRHMEFNFPHSAGSGISPLMKHASSGCVDLVAQLCTYDPDERLGAKQALRHPYFKDLRDAERRGKQATRSPSIASNVNESRLLAIPGKKTQHQEYSRRRKQQDHHHIAHSQLPVVSHHQVKGSHHIQPRVGDMRGDASSLILPQIQAKPISGIQSGFSSVLPSHKSTSHRHFLPHVFSDTRTHSKHIPFPSHPPSHHFQPPQGTKQQPLPIHHLPTLPKHTRTGAGYPG